MLILSGLLLLSLNACKEDSDPEPLQTGKITGELRLTDELGVEFSNHINMNVTAEGQSVGISTASGNYEITNLPTGTYNLTYSKSGFGTYKRFNIQVIAGADETVLNGIDYLGQKSTTQITNLSVNFNTVDSTYGIGCDIFPTPVAGSPRAFRLFFGKSGTVGPTDYQYTPSNTWLASTGSGQITGYPRSEFYSNGFSAGETVFLIAYGESIRTNSYIDPVNSKKVFPNLNLGAPSNIVSFVLE